MRNCSAERRAGDPSGPLAFTALVVVFVAMVLGAATLIGFGAPAAAQSAQAQPEQAQDNGTGDAGADDAPSLIDPAGGAPSIIPGPNSGREPLRDSDRGGWYQLGVFAVILLSVVCIVLWVRRSGRVARANAGTARGSA